METRVGRCKIWLISFDSPTSIPPVRSKHLRNISYTSRVIFDFVLNFVSMATGLVLVEFVWHHSIAHPRITPTRRKRQRDIFYMSGDIACFVSIFVARHQYLYYTKWFPGYLLYKPSYSRFCSKFRCHGNGYWSWQNLSGVIQQPDLGIPLLYAKISKIYLIQAQL